MSTADCEKLLPSPPVVEQQRRSPRNLLRITFIAIISATSMFLLSSYYTYYYSSSKSSFFGLVAIPTLIFFLTTRILYTIVGHHTVAIVADRVDEKLNKGAEIDKQVEIREMVFWQIGLTPYWIYHIIKAENIVLKGLNLSRRAAQLSGFGGMQWSEEMQYTAREAQKIVAEEIARWEVENGFMGKGVRLTQLWVRAPTMAWCRYWGLLGLSICLVVMVLKDFGAVAHYCLDKSQAQARAELERRKKREGLGGKPAVSEDEFEAARTLNASAWESSLEPLLNRGLDAFASSS